MPPGTVVSVARYNPVAKSIGPNGLEWEIAVWFDLKSEEPGLTCANCGAVGNGLTTAEGERSSYFCLTCLTRSEAVSAPARRPTVLDRLARLAKRKS